MNSFMVGASAPSRPSNLSFHYSENLLIEIQADLLQLRPLKLSEKGKWPIVRHHCAPWRKGDDTGTSDFQVNLASRMTRLACFMRLCCAIERKCQAHGGPELSFVSQLAEGSEVLPTRPDQYSLCAFRVPENSGNRLYATPEKEARRRQRRHIGSAGHEELPATDEGTLAHGVKDHIKPIQAGHEVFAAIVNDVVSPERLDKCNVCGSTGGTCLCSKRLGDLNG